MKLTYLAPVLFAGMVPFAANASSCNESFGGFNDLCSITYSSDTGVVSDSDSLLNVDSGALSVRSAASAAVSLFDAALGALVALEWSSSSSAAAQSEFTLPAPTTLTAGTSASSASASGLDATVNVPVLVPVGTSERLYTQLSADVGAGSSNACDSISGDSCFTNLGDYIGAGSLTLTAAEAAAAIQVDASPIFSDMTVFSTAQAKAQITYYYTVAPVPLPAGLPLLLAGLGSFGILQRRRKTS